MKISHSPTWRTKLWALAVFSLLGTAGCAHKELTAPCSDYKAAGFTPAALAGIVPCNAPRPMIGTPWEAALTGPPVESAGG